MARAHALAPGEVGTPAELTYADVLAARALQAMLQRAGDPVPADVSQDAAVDSRTAPLAEQLPAVDHTHTGDEVTEH
ncbi:hypothetical protein GCM10027586_02160 [Kineococcus gypseus]|uniref:hypothetical protein n=1 Tax=Kineococcus gypseus TaxID=1637102 RepID=UPI003D7E6BEB